MSRELFLLRLVLSRLVLLTVRRLLAVARWLTPDIETRP